MQELQHADFQLTALEGFDALAAFIRQYLERQPGNEEINGYGLLGEIDRSKHSDGLPLDIAQWYDWIRSIEAVTGKNLL